MNSETDFVARNSDFQALASGIAGVALSSGTADVEKIRASAYPAGGTVADAVANAIATIGENMTLRRAAMDLLARREHSRAELLDKLQRKFPENVEAFAQVLDQLALDGLLDDERFTEAYIRYRRTRGVGPLLIRQELRQKGIDGATLESALDLQSDDWHESLLALMDKKTHGTVPPKSDVKARQKLYRALLAKGYSSGMIARAFLRL